MPRLGYKLIALTCLLPAAPAFAGENAAKPATQISRKAWKPRWLPMKAPSENTHLINTNAQRLFSPISAVRITNHLRDEGAFAKEILVGGHENNVATLKLYQEENDRYTRVDIPPEYLRDTVTSPNGQVYEQTMGMQGLGTSGKQMIVAGGSSTTHNSGYLPTGKVFMVDAQTKKVKPLAKLKVARALPLVGSSPNGRYVVVAGGVVQDQRNILASKSIDVIDRVSGQHVDLAAKFPGLVDGLPEGRFAGSIAWVQEPGVDRIFFIGGATAFDANSRAGIWGQTPTKTIHFYDVLTQSWGSMELPTPRMGAGVAVRHLGDGRQEIVVAGGGTGTTQVRPIDPQIYAVERIDPKHLTVKFGENVPEQQGLYVTARDNGNATAVEWTPNALVLTHHKVTGRARITHGARFFGFGNAYKTDPVPAGHTALPGMIVNVVNETNTTINETSVVHQTTVNNTHLRVDDTRVNDTEVTVVR